MIKNNKQKYYRKRDNEFYIKYTKKEIWDRINPYDYSTVIPFLQDMDYPYIEEEWRKYLTRYTPTDGRIIGRYISLMRLKGYQGYTWSDSAFLNKQRERKKQENKKGEPNKMYQIIDTRSSGKTSRLMLLAKESNGVFVCAQPDVMKEKAWKLGLLGFDIISYKDYLEHNYPYGKMVFIDELDCFVKSLGNNLSGYSLTIGD